MHLPVLIYCDGTYPKYKLMERLKATPNQLYNCFSSPLSPKIDAGGRHFFTGNGRKNHKFSLSKKNKAVYFSIVLMPTCSNVNTCGRKLRRDKKQLIELE